MNPLSPRQQSILNRVVDTHIETGQPVGSRFITELYTGLYQSSYSPATVRYEMGALEEKGYLMHPHTSAGRIPTDRGYRYYVEHGIQMETPAQTAADLHQQLITEIGMLTRLAEKASELLSELADQLSILMLTPQETREQFQTFVRGSNRILEKTEFQDSKRLGRLLHLIEERDQMILWLRRQCAGQGTRIFIGDENAIESLQDCSVITTRLMLHNRMIGTWAIIGPKRMRYARAIPLLRQMAQVVETLLEEREAGGLHDDTAF